MSHRFDVPETSKFDFAALGQPHRFLAFFFGPVYRPFQVVGNHLADLSNGVLVGLHGLEKTRSDGLVARPLVFSAVARIVRLVSRGRAGIGQGRLHM